MSTAIFLEGWQGGSESRDDPGLDVDLDKVGTERSEEYTSRLIDSLETDTRHRLNLNVSNKTNTIENLPEGRLYRGPSTGRWDWTAAVFDRISPDRDSAFLHQYATVHRLTVEGALENNRGKSINQKIRTADRRRLHPR
jgi:alpha-galactosidase